MNFFDLWLQFLTVWAWVSLALSLFGLGSLSLRLVIKGYHDE